MEWDGWPNQGYPCCHCGALGHDDSDCPTLKPVGMPSREALEALLKEGLAWSDRHYGGDEVRMAPLVVDDLANALRALLASHATTEAEAFTAGMRAGPCADDRWTPEYENEALAAHRKQKGRVTP